MASRTRLKYNDDMKFYIWDQYQQRDTIKAIARSFDRPSSSIHQQLAVTGGIRPPPRRRSSRCLTLIEREEISGGLVAGLSLRAIAAQLNRAPSTISREVIRNGGSRHYRASLADQNALDRCRVEKVGLNIAAQPDCSKPMNHGLLSANVLCKSA